MGQGKNNNSGSSARTMESGEQEMGSMKMLGNGKDNWNIPLWPRRPPLLLPWCKSWSLGEEAKKQCLLAMIQSGNCGVLRYDPHGLWRGNIKTKDGRGVLRGTRYYCGGDSTRESWVIDFLPMWGWFMGWWGNLVYTGQDESVKW